MARILVIDDDVEILNVFSELLQTEGHEVIKAINGNEGIKEFNNNAIDLVITDMILPEKEGVETIIELKGQFPDVKIIAISGGGYKGPDFYLNLAKKSGASKVFPKPVMSQELLNAVNDLLR